MMLPVKPLKTDHPLRGRDTHTARPFVHGLTLDHTLYNHPSLPLAAKILSQKGRPRRSRRRIHHVAKVAQNQTGAHKCGRQHRRDPLVDLLTNNAIVLSTRVRRRIGSRRRH